MTIFLSVLGIVLIAGAIALGHMKHIGDEDVPQSPAWPAIMVAVALVLILLGSAVVIIPTGYTGVRTTFGQISEDTVQNGFNWKVPFVQRIQKVNNKQQDVNFDDQVWGETVNRTTLYYQDITVTYQINPEKSAWIFANIKEYKSSLVTNEIVSSAVKSSSKTLPDTDATNRAIIEPLVKDALQESLDEKYGESTVIINKVVVGDVEFEASYNAAVASKQKAQLEAEQQAIENKRAVDKAEADAKVKRTNAQASADAALIKAKAEAEANKLLEKSLTDKILRQQYLDKWNGTLPKTIVGDESGVLFEIAQ